jgi:hypothetical protein
LFGDAGANTREEGVRNLYIYNGVEAGVDGREERLFLFECGAAGDANSKVRAQITLWLGTFGCGVDQRFFIMFA